MKVVYARDTVIVGHVTVVAGSYWPADDPVVRAHPSLFTDEPIGLSYSQPPKTEEPERAEVEAPVEQATRAPGEKRATKRAG